MTSVTFPVDLGGDGSTVSDDANEDTTLNNGGYTTRFAAALSQFVNMCATAKANMILARDYALSVIGSASTNGTVSTSLSLTDSGDMTFKLNETGKAVLEGMSFELARRGDVTKRMSGVIKTFNPATGDAVGTMSSRTTTGGPYTDWNFFRAASGGVPATRKYTGAGLVTVSGDGSLAADRTITVSDASATETAVSTIATKALTPKGWADAGKAQTLTDGANIAWPITRRKAKVILGGNRNLNEPTGAVEGAYYSLDAIQDGTGGRLLSFAACYEFEDGEAPDLPTAPGAELHLYMECLSASPVRMFVRSARGG